MRSFLIVLMLLLVGYLATGISQVGPDERAVVRRFGKVVARPGPGLWIGLPWGIDRLDRVQVHTVRQLTVGYVPEATADLPITPPGQFLTGDQNLVNVKLVVEYAVDDREGTLETFVINRDVVDSILGREVESVAGEWFAGRPVDEVLLTGRVALPRWIMQRLTTRLGSQRLGIVIQRVSVDHLAPPEEVRASFEQVNQAQTAIRTQENQAQLSASQRLREAEALKFQLSQQAEAYRAERLSMARAEANAFLARLEQYRRLRTTNPDILVGIWWEEMGRTLLGLKGRGRVDLLDQHLGPGGLDVTQFLPPKKK